MGHEQINTVNAMKKAVQVAEKFMEGAPYVL